MAADRKAWRALLGAARLAAEDAANDRLALRDFQLTFAAMALRDQLRTVALGAFPVAGFSTEQARGAFINLGRGMLECGLPSTRARLARALTALADELDAILIDQAAEETARSLRWAGVGD